MENKKTKTEPKIYEQEELPQVELPKVDVKPYIGKKAKIVSADIIGTQYGRSVRFMTEVVDTLGTKEKPIKIVASKLLGLYQNDNGDYGIGIGTKTDEFFKSWGLKSHKDMIGKLVILQATEEKNGVQFLTFT